MKKLNLFSHDGRLVYNGKEHARKAVYVNGKNLALLLRGFDGANVTITVLRRPSAVKGAGREKR